MLLAAVCWQSFSLVLLGTAPRLDCSTVYAISSIMYEPRHLAHIQGKARQTVRRLDERIRPQFQTQCRQCQAYHAGSVPVVSQNITATDEVTPLVDAVMTRAQQHADVPLHVPGHKKGHGVGRKFKQMINSGILEHDLTEIPGLDYLASPTGAIAEAQQLAAQTFSADRTWFLVNGSSVGIHAATMSVAGPGDTLLIARNCHQSAFTGMTLSGCEPWWLQPQLDAQLDIAHDVTPHTVQQALQAARQEGKRVTGVLVVSPTYFGVCADIKGLADICHDAGVPLIVDEAHGAHFGLHPATPRSAMQQGADIAIQSTHKMLSAMTQAAMLHMQGSRVDPNRISRSLQMLQSSSPSYILLSSLDAARAYAQQPDLCFGEALAAAQFAVEALRRMPEITLLTSANLSSQPQDMHVCHNSNGTTAQNILTAATSRQSGGMKMERAVPTWSEMANRDPLRITLCTNGLGLSGYELAEIFDTQFHVVAELATTKVVVFVFGPGSTMSHAQKLVQAVQQLCSVREASIQHMLENKSSVVTPNRTAQSASCNISAIMTPREAFFAQSERVPLRQAIGRASGELVCPYPPGVPVLYPGELITQEAVLQLENTIQQGGKVTGASDASLQTIVVLKL